MLDKTLLITLAFPLSTQEYKWTLGNSSRATPDKNLMLGIPVMDCHPIQGSSNIPSCFMLKKWKLSTGTFLAPLMLRIGTYFTLPIPYTIPSIGEPGRSTSIPIGLQSKARQKISSSNPQLNATVTDDQQSSFTSGKWVDDDEDPRISEAMNMPGNRNSMAETRPSSLSVPGLVLSSSGSRKVLQL